VADEGTFIGEVQRGWSRFWRLSWWWKGPTLAIIVFILLSFVAGVTSDSSEDSAEYPVGSLRIMEPRDGATVSAEEIVIRGTAPPGAEVRRDIRGFERDDKFDAGADGQWEYPTKLDAGENTFSFFLQDAKDVTAKLTVMYEPPVVAEPTVTVTVTASPTPAADTPEPVTPTPSNTPSPEPTSQPVTYEIVERNPINIGSCVRIVNRVRVSGPINEADLLRIAQEVIDDETDQNDVNAIAFFLYLPGTDTTDIYTAGKVDWAPEGTWSKACDVDTGDYSTHEFGLIDVGGPFD